MRVVWYIRRDFCALTTENSDDLDIQVPHGSKSLKVTAVNSSFPISY